MKTTFVQYINYRDCPYTLHGQNLAEMSRARLYRLAQAMDIGTPDSTKQDLLKDLLPRLKAMGSETEIADLING